MLALENWLSDLVPQYGIIHWLFVANYVLAKAAVTPGGSYPNPIVDLKTSRERALDAFKAL